MKTLFGITLLTATLFQAASVSKPLTSTGAMTLIEKGSLDLNTNIINYTGD